MEAKEAITNGLVDPFADVRGVYFDLDDTLCGYWDAAKAGLKATFEEWEVPSCPLEEMLDHWAAAFREFCPSLKRLGWYESYLADSSTTRTELMRLALLRAGVDNADLAAHFSQRYMELRDRSLSLFPDAIELLDRIGPRLPLGLITNGPADLQRMEISTLQIEGRFAHIFIEGELGRGKPDPEVFSAASTAMGLEPQQILFVGNSYGHDIRPAIEAGWKTAWIRRPSDVPPSVRGVLALPEELPTGGATPDVIVTDLRDLIKTS